MSTTWELGDLGASRESSSTTSCRGGLEWENEGAVGVGDTIDGRYRVIREIGRGGMGSVVEVEDLDGRSHALKWCRLRGDWLKRFAREVRLLERVRHPHVVPVLASNLACDPPYYVMPLAAASLDDDLPRLVGDQAAGLEVFRQVCLGVNALHRHGIVHRDLKPANILRMGSGRIAVSDLGVAKLSARDTTELTQTRSVLGTFGFLAPEQLLPEGTRKADARTDVYQLGKVLYQILTGRSPVLIEADILAGGLAHIVTRATSPSPNDRHPNLHALMEELRHYELALDPASNEEAALAAALKRAEALARRQEERAEASRGILALLAPARPLDPGATIARFDQVPDRLLSVLARSRAADFHPALRAYAGALETVASSLPFDYADEVARRMRLVFDATREPGLAATAARATLVAAVALNRFAAMHRFNQMLRSIGADARARAVATMLRGHLEWYRELARDVPGPRLHPAIREVQRLALVSIDERRGRG